MIDASDRNVFLSFIKGTAALKDVFWLKIYADVLYWLLWTLYNQIAAELWYLGDAVCPFPPGGRKMSGGFGM